MAVRSMTLLSHATLTKVSSMRRSAISDRDTLTMVSDRQQHAAGIVKHLPAKKQVDGD